MRVVGVCDLSDSKSESSEKPSDEEPSSALGAYVYADGKCWCEMTKIDSRMCGRKTPGTHPCMVEDGFPRVAINPEPWELLCVETNVGRRESVSLRSAVIHLNAPTSDAFRDMCRGRCKALQSAYR